jgi:hypothetical protein
MAGMNDYPERGMDPTETVRRVLGCLPDADADAEALGPARAHAEGRGLLLPGEICLAAVDQSWLGGAGRGVLLTDRRILRYSGDRTAEIAALRDIDRVRVRRMWYPSVPVLGRGEGAGAGPVVILRFRFDLKGSPAPARLRLQDYAGSLRPFVAALAERVPRFEVARTLPGF